MIDLQILLFALLGYLSLVLSYKLTTSTTSLSYRNFVQSPPRMTSSTSSTALKVTTRSQATKTTEASKMQKKNDREGKDNDGGVSYLLKYLREEDIMKISEPAAKDVLSTLKTAFVNVPSSISDRPIETSYLKYSSSSSSSPSSPSKSSPPFTFPLISSLFTSPPAFLTSSPSSSFPSKRPLPIVLIHGFDSSCMEFRRIAPLLAKSREVYAPDIIGWGFTDAQDAKSFSPEAKIAHLKSFIRDVVGGPCVCIGASLGGAIAMILAVEGGPSLVSDVVLIDAQGFIDGKGKSDLADPFAKVGVQVLQSKPLRMLANVMSYKDIKTYATWDAMLCGRIHTLMPWWPRASLDFLKSGGFIISDKVSQVQQKTLVMWGRNDNILPPADAERFRQLLPNCEKVVYIDDCGHVPHLEKKEIVADEILTFLGDQ